MTELVENIFYNNEYFCELSLYGDIGLKLFQGKRLSKVIFLYLKSNGDLAQTTINNFDLEIHDELDLDKDPQYVKGMKNSKGEIICTLKIFNNDKFFADKRLIFVFLETDDGNFLTVSESLKGGNLKWHSEKQKNARRSYALQ